MQLDALSNLLDQERHDDALEVVVPFHGLDLRIFLALALRELRLPSGHIYLLFFRGLNLVMALAVVLEHFAGSLLLEPLEG